MVSIPRAFKIQIATQVRLTGTSRSQSTDTDANNSLVFETAYLLKHVELHGRSEGITPWSVRQFGLYQKYDSVTGRSSCIFVQASLDIQRRLAEVKKERQTYQDVISHWTCLHLICIGTLSKNWAAYIKFLDKKVAEIVSDLPLSLMPEMSSTKSYNRPRKSLI